MRAYRQDRLPAGLSPSRVWLLAGYSSRGVQGALLAAAQRRLGLKHAIPCAIGLLFEGVDASGATRRWVVAATPLGVVARDLGGWLRAYERWERYRVPGATPALACALWARAQAQLGRWRGWPVWVVAAALLVLAHLLPQSFRQRAGEWCALTERSDFQFVLSLVEEGGGRDFLSKRAPVEEGRGGAPTFLP